MQVYQEIPVITNQARDRKAEMVGISSVTEDWNVAIHREKARDIIGRSGSPFILDAGTGMYLNALLLDTELAPSVPEGIRRSAEIETSGSANHRRASREMELKMFGSPERGSIWDGELVYDTSIIYIRPDKDSLDAAIRKRSERIAERGEREVELLTSMISSDCSVSQSVLDSIGVRELMQGGSGTLNDDEVVERIYYRTRRLARRQIRWFDKLTRILSDRAEISILENPSDYRDQILHTMHDII